MWSRPERRATLLVAGLATWMAAHGNAPRAAAVNQVDTIRNLRFGSAAPDADVAGTVMIVRGDAKSTTGGVFDLAGISGAGRFRLQSNFNTAYAGTRPRQTQVTASGKRADVTNFTANNPLSGHGAIS